MPVPFGRLLLISNMRGNARLFLTGRVLSSLEALREAHPEYVRIPALMEGFAALCRQACPVAWEEPRDGNPPEAGEAEVEEASPNAEMEETENIEKETAPQYCF